MSLTRVYLGVAAALSFINLASLCQTAASDGPSLALSFTVVSIKASGSGSVPGFQATTDGLIAKGQPIFLLELAYGLPTDDFVVGAPKWLKDDSYDLVAKVDGSDVSAYNSLSTGDKGKLLRTVLRDRFKLAYHLEEKLFPEYILVQGKAGSSGASLLPSRADQKYQWRISGRYRLDAKAVALSDLCSMLLSTEAQRPVKDETNLNGKYDFTLVWSRQNVVTDGNPQTSDSAPSIFTAVKEQLGLELVSRKVPERVLVIDHIERPTTD